MTYLNRHGQPHYRLPDCPWWCGGHHNPATTHDGLDPLTGRSVTHEIQEDDHVFERKLFGCVLIGIGIAAIVHGPLELVFIAATIFTSSVLIAFMLVEPG